MNNSRGPSVSRAGQWAEFSAQQRQQRLVPGLDCPEVKEGGPLESL